MSKGFDTLCSRHDIKHIITAGKANSAERLIRTLKENLFRRLDDKHVSNWVTEITNVVDKYNRAKHGAIGLSPDDATDPRNEMYVRYSIFDTTNGPRFRRENG